MFYIYKQNAETIKRKWVLFSTQIWFQHFSLWKSLIIIHSDLSLQNLHFTASYSDKKLVLIFEKEEKLCKFYWLISAVVASEYREFKSGRDSWDQGWLI